MHKESFVWSNKIKFALKEKKRFPLSTYKVKFKSMIRSMTEYKCCFWAFTFECHLVTGKWTRWTIKWIRILVSPTKNVHPEMNTSKNGRIGLKRIVAHKFKNEHRHRHRMIFHINDTIRLSQIYNRCVACTDFF